MTVELSDAELQDLHEALRLHVGGLMDELVHTSDRSYRAGLRLTLDRLEAIQRRLAAALEQSRAA